MFQNAVDVAVVAEIVVVAAADARYLGTAEQGLAVDAFCSTTTRTFLTLLPAALTWLFHLLIFVLCGETRAQDLERALQASRRDCARLGRLPSLDQSA